MARYIERPLVVEEGFNPEASLPYDLTVEDVKNAIKDTHDFMHLLNNFLVNKGFDRLEELMLINAFAGLLSEINVKNLAKHSKTLVRNKKVGGYPDLIPQDRYPTESVLKGKGIEVKTSKQTGGWQGHNPEEGWIMVFRYTIDVETQPVEDRNPTEIVEVLAAELLREDWSFSGRKGTSRRTITASVVKSGMEKLRSNRIYLKPTSHSLKKWV